MGHERDYGYPCEAPTHQKDCHGKGTTKDHFTPQCIGKLLNWTEEQINDPENLQYLSPACHRAKDQDTPLRKEVLKRQLSGELVLNFTEHREIFEQGVIYERRKAA